MARTKGSGKNSISVGPFFILVGSGLVVFFLLGKVRDASVSTTDYFIWGFAFLIVAAGIVITFVEIRSCAKSAGPLDVSADSPDFEHAIRQLSRNYDVFRRQAAQGFVLAATLMTLGVCVILIGSVGEMFGLTKEGSNLTTIAGVVVEAVSGIGLYLFHQTFKRLNVTSDRLHEIWKLLMAFKKAEAMPDDAKRADLIALLIQQLVQES